MTGVWRPLAFAAVLTVAIGIGAAEAQTVMARNAPPGTSIELTFNAEPVASATADAAGQATLAFKNGLEIPRDVRVVVDVCGNARRVILLERYGQPPAPGEGCDRKEIPGFFMAQRVTTFVLDLGASPPTVWLRQGPPPSEWLSRATEEPGAPAPSRPRRPSPTGLVMSGGAGFTTFRDVTTAACGNASTCNGRNYDFSFTVSVDFWLTRFLAAEGSFVRPSSFNITGGGQSYAFNTNFSPYLWTIAGKVGAPIGPFRPYALAGMNYHEATSSTLNTIDERTITLADGTTQTIPGGTQTYGLKTQGWGWLFGGGAEAWVGRRVAIYGEFQRAQVKGATQDNQFSINDRVTVILAGARVRLGG